jgi:two-component system cell cycle sensor histidine kinase/response regulator CckA
VDKDKTDADYNDLQTIRQAANRAADLVRQILTFSRHIETKPRPIDLNQEVKRAEKLLYRTIPKMIAIELLLADDLKRVFADASQIEQAILNLGVNAKDAMPDGGKLTIGTENVTLTEEYCKTQVDVQPGEYVMLTASDTGHGIEEDVLDHIFEPFYSTKKPGEGTGLGLAMVFGIVKGHSGHITCYSEAGVGTTFRLYFPVHKAELKEDLATTTEIEAYGDETILLVDDEELIRDLGKRILTQRGFTVLTADDGREALEEYRNNKYDISLVILDMIMPVMGGNECLHELLNIDPDVKVLISSGFTPDVTARDTLESGAKGFVTKPFRVGKLLQAVRRVLDET